MQIKKRLLFNRFTNANPDPDGVKSGFGIFPALGMQSGYMEIVSSNSKTNQIKLATKKKRDNFRSSECRLVKITLNIFSI